VKESKMIFKSCDDLYYVSIDGNSQEFMEPIVYTKYLLQKVYKEKLIANAHEPRFDLGEKVGIYDFNIHSYDYLEHYEVVRKTQRILTVIANAYKWVDDDLLIKMLRDKAEEIRKISLGGGITNMEYIINQAIINKDTIDVTPNKTIRFLKNRFHRHEPEDDSNDFIFINRALGLFSKDANYRKIEAFISDYNLNKKTLFKCVIAEGTCLHPKTISRYLKENPELEEMYLAVKDNSGTKEQQQIRKDYSSRKCG